MARSITRTGARPALSRGPLFAGAAVVLLAIGLAGWSQRRRAESATLEGSIIAGESALDDGYRWQICTDWAMVDNTGLTSGAWTTEALSVRVG